jgi:hypothetical protein
MPRPTPPRPTLHQPLPPPPPPPPPDEPPPPPPLSEPELLPGGVDAALIVSPSPETELENRSAFQLELSELL